MKRNLLFAILAIASTAASAQIARPWMSSDVAAAWAQGYKGQGTTVRIVDQFSGPSNITGNLTGITTRATHGYWVTNEARLIAPAAAVSPIDFSNNSAIRLNRGLNIINASYGMQGAAGYSVDDVNWGAREGSMVSYAKNGQAIVVKSAGNDATSVGGVTARNTQDYLAHALTGAQSAIFVGALTTNGTTAKPATLASYSSKAGDNPDVQKQFVVVGVESSKTRLAGTSFAAPIVTGYAAILGSKFRGATATQVTNQLLDTARTDTIANYNASVHGRGEASLSRALAPKTIH